MIETVADVCVCVCEKPAANKATEWQDGWNSCIRTAVSSTADHAKHAAQCPVPEYGSAEDKTKNAWQGIQRAPGRLSGQINTDEDVFLK